MADQKTKDAQKVEDFLNSLNLKDVNYSDAEEYHKGEISIRMGTNHRGRRTDHGGGNDGDGWLDDRQLFEAAKPYHKIWDPKVKELQKKLEKEFPGYSSEGYMDYGEKGHISLYLSLKIKKEEEVKSSDTSEIASVQYGAKDSWNTIKNIDSLNGKKVTNRNLGGDPIKNVAKQLVITYKNGETKTFKEKGTIVL